MAGVQLYAAAPPLFRMLRSAGIFVMSGPSSVVRMLPPVTIERRQIDFAVENLASALVTLRDSRRRRKPEAEVELRGVAARRPARSA